MPVAVLCPLCRHPLAVPSQAINTHRPITCRSCRGALVVSVTARAAVRESAAARAAGSGPPAALPPSVECPHCARPVKTDATAPGREVKCPYPECKEKFRMPRAAAYDLLDLLPPPPDRKYPPWFEQGRQPGFRVATMTSEQVEVHRADRRKLLKGWQDRTAADAPFPFGAFEELKRQEQEARVALGGLAAAWMEASTALSQSSADSSPSLAQLKGEYTAAWRRHRHLGRDVRAAVRYLRTSPPMTAPGLRWVLADDDLRQVSEQVLPPAESPEWEGYHLA